MNVNDKVDDLQDSQSNTPIHFSSIPIQPSISIPTPTPSTSVQVRAPTTPTYGEKKIKERIVDL